jgi:hypothetical protein
MLMAGSLAEFKRVIREDSPVSESETERLWLLVANDAAVLEHLDSYDSKNESETDIWLVLLVGLIRTAMDRGTDKLSSQVYFGVEGAAAYTRSTEDNSFIEMNPSAGYIGRSDKSFYRGNEVLATFELKHLRGENDKQWYSEGAILPQSICWLCGTRSTKAAVVLTNEGYKLLYRVFLRNQESMPVFRYKLFPQDDPVSGLSLFDSFKGENRLEALARFLAILFEILVATALPIKTKEPRVIVLAELALKKPRFSTPPPSKSKREPSSEEKHKETLSKCLRQEENADSSNFNHVICQHRETELTEEERGYDFLVELSDGLLVQMRGFQPTAEEVGDQ